VKIENPEIFKLHAEYCKTLASPKRLMILAMLAVREMSVGEMAEAMGVPLANVSQHLTVLKSHNIVRVRKEGQTVYYSLVDARVTDACVLIRSLLLDNLKQRGLMAEQIGGQDALTGG
jgi:ArsR family transcriptional regulator